MFIKKILTESTDPKVLALNESINTMLLNDIALVEGTVGDATKYFITESELDAARLLVGGIIITEAEGESADDDDDDFDYDDDCDDDDCDDEDWDDDEELLEAIAQANGIASSDIIIVTEDWQKNTQDMGLVAGTAEFKKAVKQLNKPYEAMVVKGEIKPLVDRIKGAMSSAKTKRELKAILAVHKLANTNMRHQTVGQGVGAVGQLGFTFSPAMDALVKTILKNKVVLKFATGSNAAAFGTGAVIGLVSSLAINVALGLVTRGIFAMVDKTQATKNIREYRKYNKEIIKHYKECKKEISKKK